MLLITRIKTICDVCDCSRATLKRWIREEGFPAHKLDGVWRADPEDVRAWFREQRLKEKKSGLNQL